MASHTESPIHLSTGGAAAKAAVSNMYGYKEKSDEYVSSSSRSSGNSRRNEMERQLDQFTKSNSIKNLEFQTPRSGDRVKGNNRKVFVNNYMVKIFT